MFRQIFILSSLVLMIAGISSFTGNSTSTYQSEKVKKLYLDYTEAFKKEAAYFNKIVKTGKEISIQQAFLKLRASYKKIELFAEYWFPFYAEKLNGPPIPFFDEAESDMPVQTPGGMQWIESHIFPHLNPAHRPEIESQASEVERYAIELPLVTESIPFNDNNIFDAVMEQLCRITALTITGFDSQEAVNSLPECNASISALQDILRIYRIDLNHYSPRTHDLLDQQLRAARLFLKNNNDFERFNRMEFIRKFLDPVTRTVGKYKSAMGWKDNPGGEYYSAIRKNNSIFSPTAFDPYRFLDDYSTAPEKIELGRKLFFEKMLSSNGQRSCASCHIPDKAFTDGLKTSLAIDGHSALPRNAPTIWNAALQRNLFADSRSRNLENQVMQVLNNAKEMSSSAREKAAMIIVNDAYRKLYEKAFPNAPTENAAENICNAIASYERTLIALNARFDQHMNGKNILTTSEINGFNLFMGKAKCGTCHFMPLFSGAKPPRYYYIESEVLGIPENAFTKPAKLDNDSGRYLITGSPVHLFSFKTPSLRNAALTAPYMHNGVFITLEQVVDFYNNGGGQGLHISPKNQSLPFSNLHLTGKEKKDLVSFMQSLTDTIAAY